MVTIKPKYISLITWIVRLCVGVLFIFSGFVKSVDPWGSYYKISEYLGALHLDLPASLVLAGVFVLFTAEFLIGIFLLTGSFRRLCVWGGLAFMAVMLPLTLWVAVKNPVADCGCFGDAWIISNWATFCKNVALTAGLIWLLFHNRGTHWLVTPALQWILFVGSTLTIVIIGWFSFTIQPPIDFRPYAVGKPLFANPEESSENVDYVFIYEKDGKQQEFRSDQELPDEEDGWVFVDRKEVGKPNAEKADKPDGLTLYDADTSEEDVTSEVSESETPVLLLLIPDVKEVSASTTWKINELYDIAQRDGVLMAAVVYGSAEEIDEWIDLSMAEYPVYTSDDTLLKEIARGNPAVVYSEGGKIIWKMTLGALDVEQLAQAKNMANAQDKYHVTTRPLFYLTLAFAAMLAALIIGSFMPKAFTFRRPRRKLEQMDQIVSESAPESEEIDNTNESQTDNQENTECKQ